jgi:hypothetical protein
MAKKPHPFKALKASLKKNEDTLAGETLLAEAKMALQAILGGRDVVCTWTGKQHHKRLIANCKAGGLDVEAD